MSRAHTWLSCTAWHNSVEIAPPGQSSLCRRKHLRLRGGASRKETRRPASSMSLSTELWHTSTSYFRLLRSSELRADCGCSGLDGVAPGGDDDKEQDDHADEGDAETLLTEGTELFVTSCSCCADEDPLDFKSLRNQPETRRTNGTYFWLDYIFWYLWIRPSPALSHKGCGSMNINTYSTIIHLYIYSHENIMIFCSVTDKIQKYYSNRYRRGLH